MLNYATVGSNDLEKAKMFYDALLGSIGMKKFWDHPLGGRMYGKPGQSLFAVLHPYDKEAATVGNGNLVGFWCATRAEVDAFHDLALSLGGSDEGAPGPRGGDTSAAYFAYFRDLDGNKLCGYNFLPRT